MSGKKFISVFLSLVLLLFCLPLPAEAQEPVSIRSRRELEAMAEHPDGTYILEADIDLDGKEWTPIPFSGHLDGNGHAIYNVKISSVGKERGITVDGNRKEYDTSLAGFFSSVNDAVIENLTLMGVDLAITSEDHCFAGLLAGHMMNSQIKNCRIEGRGSLYSTNVMEGIGGILGFGVGQIQGCQAEVELTFADRREHGKKPKCEQFMGGIVACGNVDMKDNTVGIQGFDSCWGYVHNGGLCGLHYRYNWKQPLGNVTGNQVTGFITFFENNPDRRAYCSAYVGELLTESARFKDNTSDFLRDEKRDQTEELKPHSCEETQFTETAVLHSDEDWGYTLHRCSSCGYEYRDQYVAPGHTEGDWEDIRPASYEVEGLRELHCGICGQVIKEESIPKKIPVSEISLSENRLELSYKESRQLIPEIQPADASDPSVAFVSSNPQAAVVDENGVVTAVGRGSARITCTSRDGYAASLCEVNVRYTPLQWLIKILLFGWIWY